MIPLFPTHIYHVTAGYSAALPVCLRSAYVIAVVVVFFALGRWIARLMATPPKAGTRYLTPR